MRGYVNRLSQKANKLSKEQLLSLIYDLSDENENLNSIIESISAGLLIIDNDFYVKQYNQIVESRLNFSINLNEIKNNNLPIWELLDDEEIASYLHNCAKKKITNSSEEFSTMTSGGIVRFLSLTMTPLIKNNNVCGRIILVRDITEKKNQDVLVHRMENMAKLTNLAAGMAHDIKNPLGAISIHIQLIQKALKKARDNNNILPPKKFVEDHIDVVNQEIEHLNNVVMDFLFAVRPVKAVLELKNPAELIKNIIGFIKPEFGDNKFEIKFTSSDNSTRIMLDEKLFREIIMNFAQNSLYALKTKYNCANPPENEHGLFHIDCSVNENKYILKISDNGCGMSSETLSKIFEPYFTTKANGTGLGMTMIYKIIKEFSGEILAESEEGKGTLFTIEFPLHQDEKLALQN